MTTTIETGSLDKALRTLKLSGMLATIDARLAQARGGELGHIEFLQVLCEDEISRRETISMTRRLRKARFEEQATLEGFDFTASPKLPAAQIRDLAALRWLHAGESVILYGPVGVGKSHVAQALGHLAIRHGADVRFLKTSRALAHLAGGHADHTAVRGQHQGPAGPFGDELIEVVGLGGGELAHREVVQDQHGGPGELAEPFVPSGQGLVNYVSNTPAQ